MTDAQAALAQVREALAVGPTPGPWHHCQPFQSVRAERTIHGPVPAQRVDFVSTKTQPVHERIIIPMAGREAHVRSEDMAFIAACNPENIAALLAHVDAQAAENERLRKFAGRALGEARQFMSDVDGGDVQAWAVECGLLEEWTPTEPCGEQCECAEVADFPTQCYRLTEMGRAAIDAAMGLTRPAEES